MNIYTIYLQSVHLPEGILYFNQYTGNSLRKVHCSNARLFREHCRHGSRPWLVSIILSLTNQDYFQI